LTRRAFWCCTIANLILAGSASADLVVTLQARDALGLPIAGSVVGGTRVFVDVSVSVDGDDDPLLDLRLLQFDFAGTDSTIALESFTWELEPGRSDASYTQFTTFPRPGAVYLPFERADGFIIDLHGAPTRVGRVEALVNGSGRLDAVTGAADEGSDAAFSARFQMASMFTVELGNLRGEAITFTVIGVSASDTDGDGVGNADDAFPDDPMETTNTDGDEIGDNADPDDDGDGVLDDDDSFPLDSEEAVDTDEDGIGNNADANDDGDSVPDSSDAFPLDPDRQDEGPSNTGPRATGRLCGAGLIFPALMLGLTLGCIRMHSTDRRARIVTLD